MSSTLNADANGSTVQATVGRPIKIRFEGNPATGFTWTPAGYEEEAPSKVSTEDYDFSLSFLRNGKRTATGFAGSYYAHITPKRTGPINVKLVNVRGFDYETPVQGTFSLKLNVE